jgi:hypothetical protein
MSGRRAAATLPLLAICAAGLVGCASGAGSRQMAVSSDTATAVTPDRPGYHALVVGSVDGGSGTNPLFLSNVSNRNFKSALESSLRSLNFLADGPSKDAYVVTASIVDLDRPVGSLDPVLIVAPVDWSVTVKIHYTVAPAGGGRPVFDDVIAATGAAGRMGGITAAARVRQANEAAVRANIRVFVGRLQTEWH